MPAEVGWAACDRLKSAAVFERCPPVAEVEALLCEPLVIGLRKVRYRFPRRKAAQLAAALPRVHALAARALDDLTLRSALLALPGVGPKTASWVVRNHRASDLVAIIDVHIARAGKAADIFDARLEPGRDYFAMERRFIAFANAVGTRPSVLDQMMWDVMRKIGWLLDRKDRTIT
jgi:thermostable 8-oxoguanine DNA glycosylase